MPEITFGGPFEPVQGSDFVQEDLSSQIPASGTVQYTTSQAFQTSRLIVYRKWPLSRSSRRIGNKCDKQ